VAAGAALLAGCGPVELGLPPSGGHLATGTVTEVRLDDDGVAVRTLDAAENTLYTAAAVGGEVDFADPAFAEDTVPGVHVVAYPTVLDARLVVRGEPGATVLVGLHTDGAGDAGLGEEVGGTLALGECAGHLVATSGVDAVAVTVEGEGLGTAPDDDRTVTEDGGTDVVDTRDVDRFVYRVCGTTAGPQVYVMRTAHHTAPGEAPVAPAAVDGRPRVTGTLPPGGVAVHAVTVPPGYEVYVEARPDDGLDVDVVLAPGPDAWTGEFAGRGQPESVSPPAAPEARTVTLEVRAADGTSGGYELAVR
jgi:hypothetical protein